MGHFVLTELLYPLLKTAASQGQTARIINLSSMAHYIFAPKHGISFEDLTAEKNYGSWPRYGESKLANVLHAKSLQRRSEEGKHGVIAVSLHPGAIMDTDLARHADLSWLLGVYTHVCICMYMRNYIWI
jgi:NAD(P)-dependent dehydrogenase (short-subunit alcohol dehydrogenase family)